ncbi:MAG: phosphatase PAP2 family protein [Desulfurococcales archaeon]|nr:phosphatase PAP2 family protein [Desulfurococcales archaeon]
MEKQRRNALAAGAALLSAFTALAIADKYVTILRSYDTCITYFMMRAPLELTYALSLISAIASIACVWACALLFAVLALAAGKRFRHLIPQLITSLLITEVITALTKLLVGVPRPSVAGASNVTPSANSLISNIELMSYPSGHVARFTVLIYTLSRFSRVVATLLYVLTPVIAISRVLLNEHYCIDVIGGFLLGLGVSLVADSLISKVLGRQK